MDVSAEIARIRRRLADLDSERIALERVLETLEQKPICDNRTPEGLAFCGSACNEQLPVGRENWVVPTFVRRASRRFPGSMGKQENWTLGLFAGLHQRVGEGDLR